MTVLGEEAREVLLWGGSAVSQTGVVLVVILRGPLVRPEKLVEALGSQPQWSIPTLWERVTVVPC